MWCGHVSMLAADKEHLCDMLGSILYRAMVNPLMRRHWRSYSYWAGLMIWQWPSMLHGGLPRAYVNHQRVNLYDSPQWLGGVCSTQGESDGCQSIETTEKIFGLSLAKQNGIISIWNVMWMYTVFYWTHAWINKYIDKRLVSFDYTICWECHLNIMLLFVW